MRTFLKILFCSFLIVSCSKDSVDLSSEAKLLSFSIKGIEKPFTISASNKVEVTLTDPIDLTSLIAVFTQSPKAKVLVGSLVQTSNFTKNNFSNPIIYTVVAEDGKKTEYTVKINSETATEPGIYKPIDAGATAMTQKLFTNMALMANSSKFAFGQEFPLSFRLGSIRTSLNTSDCKEVAGDHPGVFGIDAHYMMYKTPEERKTHIDEAKLAYENGSVVTFDFHQQSRTDHKIYYKDLTTVTDKSLMYDVVNDLNGSRAWFYGELDQIIQIVNVDLGFPVVLRLFHEMDGGWFWWGSSATKHSAQLYIDLYRLACDYIKERTDLVLFGWTPNGKLNTSYYPGDNYVDFVGIDVYNADSSTLKSNLIELSTFATNHGKVAILSEVGKTDFIHDDATYWNSNLLAAIDQGGSAIKIAWALAWFNAPWKTSQNDLWIPDSNSPTTAKNDFIQFKDSPTTLFQQDVKALKVYE